MSSKIRFSPIFTPRRTALFLACGLAFSAAPVLAATIDLGGDASFSIGAGLRTSYNSIENGAANGTDSSNDFEVDNARIYLSGRVNKMIGATLNTERNSGDGVRVMDAYAQFELCRNSISGWGACFPRLTAPIWTARFI